MDNKREQRRYLEYEVIPGGLYCDSRDVAGLVQGILMTHTQFFINIYNTMNADNPDYVCPYTADDFKMDALLFGTNIAGLIRFTMPPVENPDELTRLYIGHDNRFEHVRMYSTKVDADGDCHLMTWIDDSHYYDHGKTALTEGQENKQVLDWYVEYLMRENKK